MRAIPDTRHDLCLAYMLCLLSRELFMYMYMYVRDFN